MAKRKHFIGAAIIGFGIASILLVACGGDDTTGRPPAGPDCRLTPSACKEAGSESGAETGSDSSPPPADTGAKDSTPSDTGTDTGGGDTGGGDASDGSSDSSDAG